MKDEFVLSFNPSGQGVKFHRSYLTAIENQLSGAVRKELKKHKYQGGEYTVFVTMNKIKNPQETATHILLRHPQAIHMYVIKKPQNMSTMLYDIDFCSDNSIADDANNRFFWIDPTQDISGYSPSFNIYSSFTIPSETEIEEQSRRAATRFLKSFGSFRFQCELRECDYPDVIYDVRFETAPDNETADKVLAIIRKWADNYNRRNKDSDRCIHFVQALEGEKTSENNNSVLVHIDFGECDITLIRNVIHQLDKSDLPIKEVVIR